MDGSRKTRPFRSDLKRETRNPDSTTSASLTRGSRAEANSGRVASMAERKPPDTSLESVSTLQLRHSKPLERLMSRPCRSRTGILFLTQ